MKAYIKPNTVTVNVQLEGMICESTEVDTGKTVQSTDIDANRSGKFSLWDDNFDDED